MREIRVYPAYNTQTEKANTIAAAKVNIDLERAKVEWLNSMFDRQLITTERYMSEMNELWDYLSNTK